MFENAIKTFHDGIDFSSTRINNLPKIILLLGGRLDIGEPNASRRNVFLSKMHEIKHELAPYLHAPEDYPEWNQFQGYDNLIDFEAAAGALTRAILLFSESEGAYAELGVFSMDSVLRERLLIVIQKNHYDAVSFIRYGPIKKVQDHHSENSVCVINANHPAGFADEVTDVAEVLSTKFKSFPKTATFRVDERRDRLLLLADLVELFGALSKNELRTLLDCLGVPLENAELDRSLKLILMFKLVLQGTTDKSYFVPPKDDRQSYLNYAARKDVAPFERIKFKTKLFDALKADRQRYKAYMQVHGGR